MGIVRLMAVVGALLILVPGAAAQDAVAVKKKLVLITQSCGFDHDVVKQKEGKPSVVEQTFRALAEKTKRFDVEHSRDASILTPEKLKATDIVVFYTTSTAEKHLPMKAQDLADWVNAGGLFLGIHPATDTFHGEPVYTKLINGEFQSHPWNAKETVTIKVLDPDHAAAKPWVEAGESALTFKEEIYLHKNFDPADVHVILGLDMEKTQLKKPQFIPIAWCKEVGQGKLFYTSLGHREDVWTNPNYQAHLVAAIQWLTGEAKGESKPNPDLSAKEDEIAKRVAPAEKPKEEKKAEATPAGAKPQAAAAPASENPALPKVPEGFVISTFVKAPDIKSPASIAVTPDGRLFVGEDEYNTQPKRDPGLSRVKLCADTDKDGKADRVTVFADQLNSPQGMLYAAGALYVAHAPLLTAFRDRDGDGVAEEREDLVSGLGPAPEGLVHHVPSGLRMGIDGWLYISIGDKGIERAIGRDGRQVALWGGGVVRVRPDGTMMEIFSHHTRNTFDVALDPYLNAFTRDNTNDGDGWDSRLTQMQRDGEYGYPSLFKNFPDEMIDAIASYGSGSACGAVYVQEPGFPGTFGDCLYTTDWARGILYRHDLKRKGAGFEATQEEVIKEIRPADVDVDAMGRVFIADWGRRDWGNSPPVGQVFVMRPKEASAEHATFPEMPRTSEEDLLSSLASASQIRRLEASQELIRRGASAEVSAALIAMAMKQATPLHTRVAAIFTLKQLDGEKANGVINMLASLPEVREFALRALADREDQLEGVNEKLFVEGLSDSSNPRVRLQAAIGIGHLQKRALAGVLVPVTADSDPLVRHAAMQSLRSLKADDECIAALHDSARPAVVVGAMRTIGDFHSEKVVTAVAEAVGSASAATALKMQAVQTLARLYHVEAKWDGTWWTPHPDTRGPYYVHVEWPGSKRVAGLLLALTRDENLDVAKKALRYMGLVEMKEATPALVRLIAGGGTLRDDAVKALIAIKDSSAESLAVLEQCVLGDNFDPAVRASAAMTLAALEPGKSQPILVRVLTQLDGAEKMPEGLLEKVADALGAKPQATPDAAAQVAPLLGLKKLPVRVAGATSLVRSGDEKVREEVRKIWASANDAQAEALLLAVTRLPAENSAPFREAIHARLKSENPVIRKNATVALGHLGDASAAKDLVQLASRDRDPLPAVSALAGIDPARTADDQVLVIATLLVESSAKVQKTSEKDTYARVVGAAQKFISDPRVPAEKATSLRSKLMEPGVIYQYMMTEPIPVPEGGDAPYLKVFAPEQSNGGGTAPAPFSVDGKEVKWKPLTVNDPKGMQALEMPPNSVVYLSATVEATAAGTAWLTTGSDDGLQAWVNGKPAIAKNIDRGVEADEDRAAVALQPGKNTLLLKVNNRGGGGGVQARLRTKAAEFDQGDLLRVTRTLKGDAARGRIVFETAQCTKCHTLDRHEDPRGPFLGDAGGRFDARHIVESILSPSEKIAQGFASESIVTKDGEFAGFVTRDSNDEVQLRDLTGKVTSVAKASITQRTQIPGSMMPQGLIDNLSVDDFSSLVAFLESMK